MLWVSNFTIRSFFCLWLGMKPKWWKLCTFWSYGSSALIHFVSSPNKWICFDETNCIPTAHDRLNKWMEMNLSWLLKLRGTIDRSRTAAVSMLILIQYPSLIMKRDPTPLPPTVLPPPSMNLSPQHAAQLWRPGDQKTKNTQEKAALFNEESCRDICDNCTVHRKFIKWAIKKKYRKQMGFNLLVKVHITFWKSTSVQCVLPKQCFFHSWQKDIWKKSFIWI